MGKFNIVVYGDSNTYGYTPEGLRYDIRYGTTLNRILGRNFKVYEDGVVGRTTIYDDIRPGRKAIYTIELDLSKIFLIFLFVIFGLKVHSSK